MMRRTLSVFLALCLCMGLMPAALAAGPLPAVQTITLSTGARERSDGSYDVTYTASLKMGEQFAKIVAVNKDDADTLKALRFTCTLTDGLTRQLESVREEDFSFQDNTGAFEFVEVNRAGDGIQIVYKLKEEVIGDWHTAAAETVKEQMDREMTMSAAKTVTASQLDAAKTGGEIKTDAKVEISMDGGRDIPFYNAKIILAAQVEDVLMAIDPYHSGGGGSSGTKYPIDTTNQGYGSVSANYKKAGEGTKVTITVRPEEGYRLGSLVVTDENGNRVTVTANRDGTYSFIMPGSGVEVIAAFSTAIADPEDTGVAGWLNTADHGAYMVGFPDGRFGPNDNVTRAQVAQIFYSLLKDRDVAATTTFWDVPENAWYAKAVNTLASLGFVAGVGNGSYEPDRAITRAEFSTIAVRFAKAVADSPIRFRDVPESHWAYRFISTAAAYGWVTGIGEDLFAPNDEITRAQAAVIVNRMTGRLADQAAIDAGEGNRFPDVTNIHWAWYDIGEAATTHGYNKNNGMEIWKD